MTRWLAYIDSFDQRSFSWLSAQFGAFSYSKTVRWVSRSGDGYCYAIVAFCLAYTAVEEDAAKAAAYLWTLVLGFAVEVPLFCALKRRFKRPRPYHRWPDFKAVIEAHDHFSLPSGHTTAAFLFAGISSAYYPEYAGFWYLWACLVGSSRVALGVHYPGDILAGAMIGAGLAYGAFVCVS